jgi:hypothetical protein
MSESKEGREQEQEAAPVTAALQAARRALRAAAGAEASYLLSVRAR